MDDNSRQLIFWPLVWLFCKDYQITQSQPNASVAAIENIPESDEDLHDADQDIPDSDGDSSEFESVLEPTVDV